MTEQWNFEMTKREDTPHHEEEPGLDALSPLSVRRKRATREEAQATVQALDLSALSALPSDLINQLNTRQEQWLVARLRTYSDRQACLHMAMSMRLLLTWREKSQAFRTCYAVVVQDPVNMALLVNRMATLKAGMQIMALMEHKSLKIRQWAIEQVQRLSIAQIAAEAKKQQGPQVQVTVETGMKDMMRAALEAGLLADPAARGLQHRALEAGTGIIGLLEGGREVIDAGSVREHQGRDDLSSDPVRIVGLAGRAAEPDGDGEVPDHPQGPPAGSLLGGSPGGGAGSELPPEQ